MDREEKLRKLVEGVNKQSERYGFPTHPNKKKSKEKNKKTE